jgi:membrane-bound lytic murein transglycosylase A
MFASLLTVNLRRPLQREVANAKSFVKLVNMRCAVLIGCLFGCAHAPGVDWQDDLPLAPLADAAERDAAIVERGPATLDFGKRQVPRDRYAAALRQLARAARQGGEQLSQLLRSQFDVVDLCGPTLITSYYEPTVPGSRTRSERFSQPLYALPPEPLRKKTRSEVDQADGHGALEGRGLELAWVEPFDAFVLQIEGSGTVQLDDAELALDFGGTNGQPHVRLGPFLPPAARKDMPAMESYLRALPPRELRAVLANDPRYTFFQPRKGEGPRTKLGVAAVDGRTIAVDPALPHGAAAWLDTTRPDGTPLRRLVLAEDTGGGIRGARVDLFWGRDDEARRLAGLMKQRGRLLYLVPR